MGTASPAALLSLVRGGAGTAGLPRVLFDNTDATKDWIMDVSDNDDFRISVDGSGVQEFILSKTGNLTIPGTITTSGSCSGGCDLVFDADYDLPSIDHHASEMWKYRHLPAVGATSENGPFNLSQKFGGMLNELEKAHIYIEQLHKRVKKTEALETEIADLRSEIRQLKAEKR